MNEPGTIVIAILGSSVITAAITLWFTRRKIAAETSKTNAEAQSEEVDTMSKVSDLLKEVRSENVDLYRKNTELEKTNTDKTRTIEILTERLEARDKQLDRLTTLAQQAPITETLRTQLEGMSTIIAKLQDAQSEATKMMSDKDKILSDLASTNRNLELRKPSKA